MLTPAQARILRWLGRFSADLERAWDVPRELSLPGLSEALGVVRSALHSPLNALMETGYVNCRLAHVLGGGSRRRNVYHLTESGRNRLNELPVEEVRRTRVRGELEGEPPGRTELKGRETLIKDLIDSGFDSLTMVGIAGIGKTSLARELVERLVEDGRKCSWIRCNRYDDPASMAARFCGDEKAPESAEAAANWCLSRRRGSTLIIDDLQDIHERHRVEVSRFIKRIDEKGDCLILISRAPAFIEVGRTLTIEEVDEEAAMRIIGEEVSDEDGSRAYEHLGGHPLALHMWNPDQPLAGAHIRRFVEETVFTSIPDELMPVLDHMATLPIPVLSMNLDCDDGIADLDDHALIRWEGDERVELQHLVRNVRRECWNEDEVVMIHGQAAERWAAIPGAEARLLELHMRTRAGDETTMDMLDIHGEMLIQHESAAMATLVSDACLRWPDSQQMRRLSVSIALDRGEVEHAENEMEQMSEEASDLKARILRQKGRWLEAKQLIDERIELLSGREKVRLQISEATLSIQDRLPDEDEDADVESIEARLRGIAVSELDIDERKKALVAIASIRHSLALATGRQEEACRVRMDLTATTTEEDPLIKDMLLRENIRFKGHVVQVGDEGIRSVSLQLMSLQNVQEDERSNFLETIPTKNLGGSRLGRRLAADIWLWKGIYNSGKKLFAWREAIHLYNSAECSEAASKLTQRMHSLLR